MPVHPGSGALESVGVIMPTLALAHRADALRAAISSVVSQSGVRAIPLVVVNGSGHDPALVEELSARADIRLVKVARADLPGALRAGRDMVDTPWFCELDDDDLLLPGTLAELLVHMNGKRPYDVVVCNGIVRGPAGDHLLLSRVDELAADPLAALAQQTWLSPGGALFRSSVARPEMFADLPPYLEWTCLALRLAHSCRIAFVDRAGFIHHDGLPDSLWRSRPCVLGLPAAIQSLLAQELPPDLRRSLERRFVAACHAAACAELDCGQRGAAWRWHLQSLSRCQGWRYLSFTRHLLAASLLPAATAP
jgi:hypothetical protein